ncbi:helix-turn-helix domain-containing protein [Vitreoscilla massiliensis]|uniref:Helix-turn-helix domain-containing protein n=1 Tax=Vitreoscilla massiliensis TaxID=1689272 RepID=A0ABY4E0R5_9NEIS|nr:hypothetical protein [Vitreoscilla massiliensis]UOO89117.1 helix-turn-helix domain-containing protein [Vitreoscilla massiliensis]
MAGKAAKSASKQAARGRPTKYKAEYAEQARKLCLLGATDVEMADFFEVSELTINRWKKEHPEFCKSIKKGKLIADAEVADKLYNRATGYDAPDTDIRVIDQKIVETPIIKHYPPDPVSGIFWLKNRQPKKWRDKPDEAPPENQVTPVKVVINVQDARKPGNAESESDA